jgi:hypothetical protein
MSGRFGRSVILIGCADDLVVPDPRYQYASGSVRGYSFVRSLTQASAKDTRRT